ncbi:hypothetical protein [Sulfitobacter noctilucicola]|uniref:Uncharacterized protein n=2 Tax=Sulfitobacter noctilucicola TaxID=1342301 RepID=A0A7W6Q587_9RHOB|nr:hypothetical protein [Sulfitobacter noctilucicola]MBB4174999.1 hypothetical protein [Sulfitobacter noctilucicola]
MIRPITDIVGSAFMRVSISTAVSILFSGGVISGCYEQAVSAETLGGWWRT